MHQSTQLQAADVPFGRTHNLIILLDLSLEYHPELEMIRGELQALNAYAIHVRYPGESADVSMARHVVSLCGIVRTALRADLGLPAQ